MKTKQLTINQLHEIIDAWQPKEIIVKCKGSRNVQFHDLADFQGKLKRIKEIELLKLCVEILKLGFIDPIKVWRRKILDGHQRKKALLFLQDKGFTIPPIPVTDTSPATDKEAKADVLSFSSVYATVDKDEHKNWCDEVGEDIDKFTSIINIDKILADINIDVDTDPGPDKSTRYDIIVTFEDKEKRQEFFDKLKKKGYFCRLVK